ncbi:uncharacterized protein LOC135210406 [Macrobrachium nipponense]|uniref:uncharacterized protein LOC135210406 n=1 Tax=Macrobrachium nipponense TaxID=159736 RepID=UPI0030C82126
MLGNKRCLIKAAVAIVTSAAILLVNVCYEFENVFLRRSYVSDTVMPMTSVLLEPTDEEADSDDVVRKYGFCKALFSLENPASREKIEYIYSEKILSNATVGSTFHGKEGTKGMEPVKGLYPKIDGVLRKIRKLKYSDPENLFGEDYRPLAELLPRVAEYDSSSENEREAEEQQNHSRDEPKHKTDPRTKHVKQRTSSRIVEETLPFVPCSIRDYEDKRQVFACFQKRLDVKGSLSIHFLGDSKIRHLLHQFLEETDDVFRFVTVAKNITRLWSKAKVDLMTGDKWSDVEVFVPTLPGLQITLNFRRFKDSPDLRRDLPEIQQLKKWANLEEPPPDLLILGMSDQTRDFPLKRHLNSPDIKVFESIFQITLPALTLHNYYGFLPPRYRHTIDVLAILLELHAKVVPLLDKISKTTRVLVLSQSRMRVNAKNIFTDNRGALADFNHDWSESTFLYILDHYRDLDFKSPLESRLAKALELLRVSDDNFRNYAWKSLSAQPKASGVWRNFQGTKEVENESALRSGSSYSAQSKTGSPVADADIFPARLHRVAREKLMKKASVTTTTSFRDYLIPSKEGGSGLWFWDALIPLNLAEIQECQEMFERGLTEDPLYQSTVLWCLDSTHAGSVTYHDLITMMLNLLCNTVLETEEDYCCS